MELSLHPSITQSSDGAQILLPPSPPSGWGFGRAGGAASPTHDVMVRGEVEGVLVPQQAVVGVVPVALVAVGTVVIIVQDLGDREEEEVRPKPKGSL